MLTSVVPMMLAPIVPTAVLAALPESPCEARKRRRLRASGIVLALALVAAFGSRATAAPSKCLAAKVKAAGKKAAGKTGCYSKALQKDLPVDPICLEKAEAKFTAAFAKADTKNENCAALNDAAAVEATVDAFVNALLSQLQGRAATCSDTVKNGDETDVDCGGSCTSRCSAGQMCLIDTDCQTGGCAGGVCVSVTTTTTVMSTSTSSTTSSTLPSTHKVVFLTSAVYNGNLGGLSGADAICNAHAAAGSLPGTYKAWLSTITASPSTRFTHPNVPYVLPDGTTVVANDWADLTDGSLAHAINQNEASAVSTTFFNTWTGTSPLGTSVGSGEDCSAWTNASSFQLTSQTGDWWSIDARWTVAHNTFVCSAGQRLYCFQQ